MFPEEFTSYTSKLFGEECWQRFLEAFSEEVPVSIRLNPFKLQNAPFFKTLQAPIPHQAIPWCRNAFYLTERPKFTLDPMLHAGAYYVQEASSMFLDHVLKHVLTDEPIKMLDLCAAPGGKSTLARAALPEGSLLMSNEPDRRRANILMENMQKQGHPDVIVTNNYPRDYRRAKLQFDVILTDVPCSGEGMFRKDQATIKEWSMQNVMKCAELQRSIVEDIWPCLNPGGILIYSTCTFNLHEDEENVLWIMEHLGADIIPIPTEVEWNICPSLMPGHKDLPVYRFIPGTTRGEGLFMAVLKKKGEATSTNHDSTCSQQVKLSTTNRRSNLLALLAKNLHILSDGHPVGMQKGKDIIPAHAEALLINSNKESDQQTLQCYPTVEISLDDALRYLRREVLQLPADTPRGYIIVTYQSLPLGFVKNIGSRANNLYPQEWRIKHQ